MIDTRPTLLDRFLGLLSVVRPGEGRRAVLLLVNVFLLLTAYYVVKTVREPMILADGSAELKSWASAGQALALLAFVPAYGWVSSRLPRRLLVVAVSAFFVLCLQAFYPAAVEADAITRGANAAEHVAAGVSALADAVAPPAPGDATDATTTVDPGEPSDGTRGVRPSEFLRLGFVFYVWVGIFSLAMIAQFWSFANDIYTREQGDRLFPIVALGATAGAAFGSKITSFLLFDIRVGIPAMLQIATAVLVVYSALMWGTSRAVGREHAQATGVDDDVPVPVGAAFALVLRSPYLRLLAIVILLLNLVNTNGEYILSRMVVDTAKALEAAGTIDSVEPYIGRFYGDFFSVVNIATLLVQGLLVSRIVRYTGIRGALLLLPVVALGAYTALAAGVGLAVFRWAKTAENTTDYSVMNTVKALVWLPTSRAEKYKAKQAIDTFVVRLGDLAATGLMLLGTQVFAWSVRGFAAANVALVVVWIVAVAALVRRHRALVRTSEA